ncbi:MAG: penicillin-binding transpeptidase domain-containing protein [Thermoanaerobaculia bacterium]|jgi:cell division protein FtsI (penicillin-binding protein 3)
MTLSRKRLLMLGAFLVTWSIVVVGRLAQVQILRHDDYVAKAARQQERTIELSPVRGSILDTRGRILAESVPAYSIYADPQAIADRRDAAKKLAAIKGLGLTRAQLEQKLKADSEFAWIARQVDDDVAHDVRKLELAGIYSLEEHVRAYPKGRLAASVLGFVNVDGGGLSGAELAFEPSLGGRAGRVTVLRDARRGVYLVGGEGKNAPVDGVSVELTIDEVIQYIAESELAAAIESSRAASGSVVVMDPNTGAILALASLPDFDPNRFRDFSKNAWRNHAIQDLYEPGSTFKIITGAAGLEEGRVTPSQVIDCEQGFIEIAGIRIREHGGHKYGYLTFEEVMAHSSNVGAIKVGLSVGPEAFYRRVTSFGFGSKSGIDLPGEGNGILRAPKKWSKLTNAVMSIGQEIAVTPLQIARATAAIANGGMLVTPHVLSRVVDREGNVVKEYEPPSATRVISEKNAAVLNEILKGVVANGTGKRAALEDHMVAGKTGTAQKAENGRYSPDKTIASFVGYVPADRPRLVILVVVDEPTIGQYGGEIAAPAFKKIAEATLRYMRVEPSIPGRNLDVDAPVIRASARPAPPATPKGQVPDLRGLDARDAIAAATAAGLRVRTSGEGVVATQSLEPGSVAGDAKFVKLTLTPAPRQLDGSGGEGR